LQLLRHRPWLRQLLLHQPIQQHQQLRLVHKIHQHKQLQQVWQVQQVQQPWPVPQPMVLSAKAFSCQALLCG
jgi:hypothetical protein